MTVLSHPEFISGSKRLIIHRVLFGVILFYGSLTAQTNILEAKVKSAYIYNFAKFVEFDKKDSKLKICIVGSDNIYNLLKELSSKDGNFELFKDFEIVHTNCDILFLSAESQNQVEILKTVSNYHVLTVGESDNFLDNSGVIELFNDGSKIKFNINLAQAKKINLKISSKLLELAKNVKR